MNNAQKEAIKAAISNVQDDLYRFRLQAAAKPDWVSGNGEPIDEIIMRLEAHLAELKQGL